MLFTFKRANYGRRYQSQAPQKLGGVRYLSYKCLNVYLRLGNRDARKKILAICIFKCNVIVIITDMFSSLLHTYINVKN